MSVNVEKAVDELIEAVADFVKRSMKPLRERVEAVEGKAAAIEVLQMRVAELEKKATVSEQKSSELLARANEEAA